MSSMSAPATTARTAASSGPNLIVAPAIWSESVMITPWKPSLSRSSPVSTALDIVAGSPGLLQAGDDDVRGHDDVGVVRRWPP